MATDCTGKEYVSDGDVACTIELTHYEASSLRELLQWWEQQGIGLDWAGQILYKLPQGELAWRSESVQALKSWLERTRSSKPTDSQ